MVGCAIDNQLTEKCAVFGAYGAGLESARLAFYGLWALQHRGQESSGIASSDGTSMHRHAALGLVANAYHEEDLEQLPGHIAIGHNRYSTSGGRDERHNQPFMYREQRFAFAHNGNLPVCDKLIAFLHQRHINTAQMNDSGMMAAAISCYMEDDMDIEQAIAEAFPLFEGVFSAVAMDTKRLIAFRDRCGVRPLSIGTLDGGYVIASETCAFDTIGAKYLRDVKPGEMVIIDQHGLKSVQIVDGEQKLDVFEYVYFARPDSVLLGQSVNEVRREFGREMAKQCQHITADVVMPIPDSAIPAALGYAYQSGVPFDMGLIKNRYIHRTFIRPTPELRVRDLKMKLNPVPETIAGKRVIVVDDSIVRGTTMKQYTEMIFAAGAREVHLMISSPPVRYPDFYGINTPNQADLLAANMNPEQMREYLGATSLNFLSFDGMVKATGLPASMLTTSCFTGEYPIPIGNRAQEIEKVALV
jgi:amidophosphoribosyltransferase